MNQEPGRTCPLRYRYGPRALAVAPEQSAEIIYVIGGLYGNLPALEAILVMARQEAQPVRLCFNGDFNWFNVDDASFNAVNEIVLTHDASQGNVEAELAGDGDEAGCGCAYPEDIDAATVWRSNEIHAQLKRTAQRHPLVLARLATLPMVRRYRVGHIVVGVVHGDAESLAGWRFDTAALDDPNNQSWLAKAFDLADVDVFASSHTCLPALRNFDFENQQRLIINNGAAGMPNFRGLRAGIVTRIAIHSSPHETLYGKRNANVSIDALPVRYDYARWAATFLGNWPEGSAAHTSYYRRFRHGPDYLREQARSRRTETELCP